MSAIKKVVVGMSGGVDSSVVALLLKKAKYQVHGVFMVNWDSIINDETYGFKNHQHCNVAADYRDVMAVSRNIDVATSKVNFVEEYWRKVFRTYIDQLAKGYTPNPDVLCNQFIKFTTFFQYCKLTAGEQLHFIAMGHYARIWHDPITKKYLLLRALDLNKDQTYFLSRMNQHMLRYTAFPIGGLLKSMVRTTASQAHLSISHKKDSTGICFIGERKLKLFLKNYLPQQRGLIINIETDQTIGSHDGYAFYTIGQRRDLNLGGQPEPFYVVAKNVGKNILYVARKSTKDKWLRSNRAWLQHCNLVSENYRARVFWADVQFRYQQTPIPVEVKIINRNHILINYDYSCDVTPGQEAVFYRGMVCLGGGQIMKVFWNEQPRHLLG